MIVFFLSKLIYIAITASNVLTLSVKRFGPERTLHSLTRSYLSLPALTRYRIEENIRFLTYRRTKIHHVSQTAPPLDR